MVAWQVRQKNVLVIGGGEVKNHLPLNSIHHKNVG